MKAIIQLDVPDWQIGQDVTVYFPDTMMQHAKCELLKEQEAVKPKSKVRHRANAQIQHFCGRCNSMLYGKPKYCSECGQPVKWN